MGDDPKVTELYEKVAAQGDAVRTLKAEKASKEKIDAAVKVMCNEITMPRKST